MTKFYLAMLQLVFENDLQNLWVSYKSLIYAVFLAAKKPIVISWL